MELAAFETTAHIKSINSTKLKRDEPKIALKTWKEAETESLTTWYCEIMLGRTISIPVKILYLFLRATKERTLQKGI